MLRRLLSYVVLLLIPFAFLEAFGFVSRWLLDDLYDHRGLVLARIDEEGAKIDRYPAARIVILGIMYENIYRMVNSYRPVLYDKSETYGLKPYMADGRIVPHPGAAALHDVADFRARSRRSTAIFGQSPSTSSRTALR